MSKKWGRGGGGNASAIPRCSWYLTTIPLFFTAVKFGKGIYFAKQAWYSARYIYSVPDRKGLQYMYIARVLVGKYTKGKEGLIIPPPIDENNQIVRYDSVVDNVINPLMFVIFYDYRSYPEYLVTFKNS
jgi:hypothetical protein